MVFLLVLVKHRRIAYCFGLNYGFGIALCLSVHREPCLCLRVFFSRFRMHRLGFVSKFFRLGMNYKQRDFVCQISRPLTIVYIVIIWDFFSSSLEWRRIGEEDNDVNDVNILTKSTCESRDSFSVKILIEVNNLYRTAKILKFREQYAKS